MKLPKLPSIPKRVVITILVLLVSAFFGLNKSESKELQQLLSTLEQTQPGLYRVANVDDGDTITVYVGDGVEKVRFIGIDTPETQHPKKPVQCFGKAASAFTRQLIGTNDVRLEADPQDDNRDIYGRLLRYVYLPDGTLINSEIIANGYGFAYIRFPFDKKAEFIALQDEARRAKRGLWDKCKLVTTKYQTLETAPAE